MSENKVIDKLTPEQEAKFPEYVDKWVKIGFNTDPCDFEKAIEASKKCYIASELPEPTIFIGPVNNPYEASLSEIILHECADNNMEFESPEAVNQYVLSQIQNKISSTHSKPSLSNQIYGNHEYWLSFYDYCLRELELNCCEPLTGLMELSTVCGWWTPLADVAIFQHRPIEIHIDDQNRIHNLNGPAIKFRGSDYCDVYAVHGVRVTKDIIDFNFTVDDIEKESNLEVRRVMIELYGQEKFLLESKAEVIHQDDFGTLYKKEISGDEPIMMVKVVNSTPEEDGSFKDYFIRVDPNAYGGLEKLGKDSPLAAVASTWRNRDGSMVFSDYREYDPDIQT